MAENDWFQIVSSSMRMLFISIIGQAFGIYISSIIMERRRSLRNLALFMGLKAFWGLTLVDVILPHYFAGSVWVTILRLVTSMCGALIAAFLFYYTFRGSLLKNLIGMNLSEMLINVIMLPAVGITNFLEGREDLYLFRGEFQMTDFLIPVIEFVMVFLFVRVTKPILKQFRTWKIPHPKFWWTFYIIYFVRVQLVGVAGVADNNIFLFTMYFSALYVAAGMTIVLFLIYVRRQKAVVLERKFLNTQMRLMFSHYITIREQATGMEACQKQLEEQMQGIIQTKDSDEKRERIRQYQEDLKERYDNIRAGMYCNNWHVDAVLYCQMEVARVQGIQTECLIQGFSEDVVTGEVFARIAYLLLDFGLKEEQESGTAEKKKLSLRTGRIMNQFVIEFYASGARKEKFPRRALKVCLKECKGELRLTQEQHGLTAIIYLEINGIK